MKPQKPYLAFLQSLLKNKTIMLQNGIGFNVKKQICNRIILSMGVMSLFWIPINFIKQTTIELKPLMIGNILLAIIFWILYLERKHIYYKFRAAIIIFTIVTLAITSLLEFGLLSGTSIWFIAAPILANILFNKRTGINLALLSVFSFGFIAFLNINDSLSFDFYAHETTTNKAIWLDYFFNHLFAIILLLIAALKTSNSLKETIKKYEENKNQLEQQINCLNKSAIVLELDSGGNIMFVNDKFCEISEYSREELIGQNHGVLKSGIQPDSLFVGMESAISSGRVWKGELVNRKKGGKDNYWVDTTIMPFKDLKGRIIKYVGIQFDITDQVKQHKEILRVGAEARAIQSAVDTGWSSVEFTLEGSILKVNDNFANDLGYFSKDYLVGKHHKIFCDPDYVKSTKYKQFWNNLTKNREQKGVFKNIRKDGSTIWVNANYTPVKDSQGNIFKVIKIANDISEKINNRNKANAITNELRHFIETANAPIFGIDNNGLVNEWNQNSEKITRYKKEEVLGKNLVTNYITEDYQEAIKKVLDDALLGKETASHEFPLFTKTGERLMVLLNSSTRHDVNGNITGVLGVGQDITEIDKLRTKSESIAKELRQFIETSNAPIFGIDNKGLVNEWNQSSEKITGYTKEEVFGKNLVKNYITEDYQKAIKKVLDNALLGKETASYEFPLFTKTGKRLMVLLNASTRRDVNGEIKGVIGVGQDITELVTYRNKLELKVNQRTKVLRETLKKQKELNELKSKFVSTASHEFRTPLSAINFAAGSIKKYWTKMSPVMLEKKLNRIENQVDLMTELLDDILMIGQGEVDEIINTPVPINLGKFMTNIIEEVYHSYKGSHQIELIDLEELKNSTIFIDEKLGRNIFINLISNAVKFSPEAKKVIIELFYEKNQIVISVIDFGIGIPKTELDNIFNPFTRAENVALIQGNGLGLSIVKDAIHLLEGEIIVNSIIDKGTTFIVKIPII